tara:strand:+ start:4753 stop:5370 length:618 start_codon:yes stop_codon:yes gene_type:complete
MSKIKPLIVFEGIEGSGKTTIINYVSKYLKKKKISFIKIREPGGNKNSEKIRKLILNKKNKFNPLTDLMLYLASRSENIENVIKINYKKKIILLDRFVDSTIAYQHYGMGINKSIIVNINKILLKKIKPNITFLNIVNMQNLKKRLYLRKNKNRYDNFKIKFYKKVQAGFVKLSKNKKNYVIIDSNKNLVENKKKVLNKIIKFIN